MSLLESQLSLLMLQYLRASYVTRRLLECKDMKNQQDSKGADNWTGMR